VVDRKRGESRLLRVVVLVVLLELLLLDGLDGRRRRNRILLPDAEECSPPTGLPACVPVGG
jgi:hypothetical protein